SVAELVPFENAGLLEQANGSVNRRDRDVRVDRRGSGMKSLDVRMIVALTEHARNRLALLGDAQALVGAQRLDIDLTRHSAKLSSRPGFCECYLPPRIRRRFVPRPIDLASVRRCSA